MLLSNLFLRHKTPKPRFAPGLFLILLALFTLIGQARPALGLVGIGTTLIVAGALVEINRNVIWETYQKAYRRRGRGSNMSKPNHVYYVINVVFLWPFIIFLGVIALWAAYLLS